jgi:hypothetical protein
MTTDQWFTLVSLLGVPGIITGVLVTWFNHKMKQNEKRDREQEEAKRKADELKEAAKRKADELKEAEVLKRAEARRAENVLILQGILISGDLSKAIADGHQRGEFNGPVTKALDQYECYRQNLNDFLLQQNACRNH